MRHLDVSGRLQDITASAAIVIAPVIVTPAAIIAIAVVTAVTVPRGHQYALMEVMPTAPMGPLPPTYEEWGAALAEQFAP